MKFITRKVHKNQILEDLDELIEKIPPKNRLDYQKLSLLKKQKDNKKNDTIINDIEKLGFNEAAVIHSISDTSTLGGEIGWINQSQLSKKIFNQIKNLKKGEYSNPILTAGGSLILKIIDIKDVVNDNINKEESFQT